MGPKNFFLPHNMLFEKGVRKNPRQPVNQGEGMPQGESGGAGLVHEMGDKCDLSDGPRAGPE